jgi:peptidyl-prolyl cis-trans isomerase B (cyclophilin B)
VAPSKQNDRESRQARERLRAYQARQGVHETRVKRRKRDNWIAGITVLAVVLLAVGAQLLYFSNGPGKPAPKPTATAGATPSATPSASSTPSPTSTTGLSLPPKTLADNRTWTGTMKINDVDLGISLDGAKAPQAVSSTIYLVQKGFYDGLTCQRLTNGGFYILQCGSPDGTDSGGPGYSYGPIENAPTDNVYPAGTIAMARVSDQADSQGSQFFIVYKKTTIPADSAGGYTVIGQVTSGLDKLNSEITGKGIQGGSTDGKPNVKTVITGITVK